MVGKSHEECEEERDAREGFLLAGIGGGFFIKRVPVVDAREFLQHQERFVGRIPTPNNGKHPNEFCARFRVSAAISAVSQFARLSCDRRYPTLGCLPS